LQLVTIIAIDGPTGVGKSTTSRLVADRLGASLLLDPVSISPLLDDYYTGDATPAAAIDTELAFLRSRAELLATAPADGVTVSDFSVMRTAPFAEFLDDRGDRAVVLDEMRRSIRNGSQPDVLVLLRAEPAALLDRVRTRDRAAETDLTIGHLDALRDHFDRWHDELLSQAASSITIDTASWDPRRPADLDGLLDWIDRLLA